MLLVVFLVAAVGEFVCLDTKHGITQHTPVIHTPSMSTTAPGQHNLVVDEIVIGEIYSDVLLYYNFFGLLTRIDAPLIIGE